MKKLAICFAFIISLIFVACKTGNENDKNKLDTDLVKNTTTENGVSGAMPEFKFEEEEHNFGNVYRGEKVSYEFKFKNVGKADLIISDANASCGCTVPEYPKNPIKPNEEGKITVTYNSEGKQGVQNKSVTLVANTVPNTKVLKIMAMVIAPEEK